MKLLLVSLIIFSFNVFANDYRLIDQRGLLKPLNAQLKNRSLSEYHKGDEAEILTQGQLKVVRVKKANSKVIVLKGNGKRSRITAEDFEKANHNMMNVVLSDSNVRVTVNGTEYLNTYIVESVTPTTHTLDDGTVYKAYQIVVTSPDVQFSDFGMDPMITMVFVIAPEAPAIAQMLKVSLNGNEFFNVRSVTTK